MNETSEHAQGNPDLLYGLHDRPEPTKAFLGAIQHVLAAFVGICYRYWFG